jgi:hypothetical protein
MLAVRGGTEDNLEEAGLAQSTSTKPCRAVDPKLDIARLDEP